MALWMVSLSRTPDKRWLARKGLPKDIREDYPRGPQRFACISQKNPGVAIRQERCKEEGRAMGLLPGAGGRKALGQYVMSCMQRNR